MRRLLLFAMLFSALLALPAGAHAGAMRIDLRQYASAGTATLELLNGNGSATLVRRSGAILGRVGRGRIVVTAPRGQRPGASLAGCERRYRPRARTVVCSGRRLSFSTSRDRRVELGGSRIFVSAVMRGRVSLEGTQGTYSIEGVGSGWWPRTRRTWSVGG